MRLRDLGIVTTVLLLACSCGTDPSEESEPVAVPPDLDAPLPEGGVDTWTTYAGAFFSTYCPSCHGGSSSASRDYRELEDVREDGAAIRCGIATEELPGCEGADAAPPREFPRGSGPKPTDAQRDRIVVWIESGMPE